MQAGDLSGAQESFFHAIAVADPHENVYWRAIFLANIAFALASSTKEVPHGGNDI